MSNKFKRKNEAEYRMVEVESKEVAFVINTQ